MKRTTMWDEGFVEACRRHSDLVAVYESPHGRLALLLRQTLVPLGPERFQWLAETRTVARAVVNDLRAAGFRGGTVVLQWLRIEDVANIVTRWVRRWDGDRARRTELLAVVAGYLADERFLEARASDGPTGPAERADATVDDTSAGAPQSEAVEAAFRDDGGLEALREWYVTMAPSWLGIQPAQRRRLVLQTHAWIAERVLLDPAGGSTPALEDLEREGFLARALQRLVGRRDLETWWPWIELVRLDLQRALTHPPARRTQAWARWLFLIPYGVPTPRRVVQRSVTATRPA